MAGRVDDVDVRVAVPDRAVLGEDRDAALALESLLSIIRSPTCWCLANVPAWTSSLSTSVVLPWSTWAMIAMLRRFRRGGEGVMDAMRAMVQCGRVNRLL